ncbi:probable starch synthase 4, chloroplastic/amyloplastic isoform X2 [Vigna radiata var. radiata]|uniref:starch synthase n=1 Tax=Vigna radiata var. radiata TaxID=3916 RepID=A0A3Q0FKB8_VIGRR|nr:probable starch synthase 4, chloroplastic/amyloplastic isoform X2 [Vigna radiata var. radiata]
MSEPSGFSLKKGSTGSEFYIEINSQTSLKCWWDVVSGLGKALQKKGHLVEIVLLKYDCMQYDHVCNLRAPLYWEIFVHKGLNSARICFTCHNFEYQGTAVASELD